MADAPFRNDGVTMVCPVCRTGFVPTGRRRFCSAGCRQAAWRRCHPTPLPTLPVRTPRPATVYECPVWETRLLGEQRCPDYQVFCRRVGPGGACPHYDHPVALTDLIPAITAGTTPR